MKLDPSQHLISLKFFGGLIISYINCYRKIIKIPKAQTFFSKIFEYGFRDFSFLDSIQFNFYLTWVLSIFNFIILRNFDWFKIACFWSSRIIFIFGVFVYPMTELIFTKIQIHPCTFLKCFREFRNKMRPYIWTIDNSRFLYHTWLIK